MAVNKESQDLKGNIPAATSGAADWMRLKNFQHLIKKANLAAIMATMNNKNLYILTFLAIAVLTVLASLGAMRYFYINAKDALIEQKMESGRREIRELGILLEQQLQAGVPPENVINHLQQSILNTDVQSEFVCMYNTEGIELCHPDPSLVGMKIEAGNSSFSKGGGQQSFQDLLKSGQSASGFRAFPATTNRNSEIVSVYPVKGTDWMLASHTNMNVLQKQQKRLYGQFLTGALLMALILIVACCWIISLVYRKYQKKVNTKITGLNDEINHLSSINKQLQKKQQITSDLPPMPEENKRKRLITYQKDEIISIETADIVYIALNENATTVLTFNGKTYDVNSSLDDLMKQLDTDIFYRANRQYIVNVNGIESIWMYGRNQLRIETKPRSAEPIIISKNKVTEFKKWLDR